MDLKKLAKLAKTNPSAAKAFLNKKDTSQSTKKVEKQDRVFTEKQLDTIVRSLVSAEVNKIPKPKDGKTPSRDELQKIIAPLIPVVRQPKDGKDGEVTEKHIDDITNRILKQVGKTPDLTEAIVNVFKDEKIQAEDLPGFKELKERVEKLANNQKYLGGKGIASGYTDSDVIRVANANGGFGGSSPLTTKGDLYTYDTDDARLPIGANGEVLTADSAEATGMKWAAVAGTGDVTAASAFSTDNRLIRSDGTGKGVQASGITVSDTDAVSGATIDADNNTISNIALGAEATGAINDLSDVTITTPANNEVLAYDGVSAWINQTPSEAGLQAELAEGAFVDGDKTKLDGIETGADVTDTANVTSAGALMDSELTDLTAVKTLSAPDNTTISTFGASLVDDADAATARATLGVDAAGTDNSTDVTLAGTPDYITISGQTITRNQIDLTTDVTGVLPEANLPNASTTAEGVVELATNAETVTGTDTTRAVTPDGLTDRLAAPGTIGGTTPSAATFTDLTSTGVLTYDAARGKVTAGGNLGATETINFNDETNYTGTLDSNITFTFANATSGDDVTLYLTGDGTQRTITWPTITWLDNNNGGAPTTPTTSGQTLVVTIRYVGTVYYGSATGNYTVYA